MEDVNLPDAGSDDLADLNLDDGDATQPSGTDARGQSQHGSTDSRKYAGRFSTPEELEKSYLGMRKGYDEKASRAKQLEEILSNPRLQHMAQIDPEVRGVMEKAGFELKGLEEAARGEEYSSPMDEQVALIEAKNELRWELRDFEQSLGRRMSVEERTDLLRAIERAPNVPVEEAWRLTPHYERNIQAKHQQELDSLRKVRQNVDRPMPGAKAFPGQKLNLNKPVTEMNGNERTAFLQKLINKGGQE